MMELFGFQEHYTITASVGMVLKKLNLWVINDVIWFKRNAAPLLSKNRLAPSTELIWVASKSKNIADYELQKY